MAGLFGRAFDPLPLDIVVQLSDIAEARGRAEALHLQAPRRLAALGRIAIAESVAAANAFAGTTPPAVRIAALASNRTTPRDRAEQEIAGYRYALGQVHEHRSDVRFEPRTAQQIHGWLSRYTGAPRAGQFRATDNTAVERRADGATVEHCVPVDADSTAAATAELHRAFAAAVDERRVPYLLLCAAYLLDFLTIHPFTDDNGRVARLLALLLLYGGGFEVGRYISLERLIEETSDGYYQALAASTAGWHEDRHDPLPWTRYFLGVLVAAYRELDRRTTAATSTATGKREAVRRFVRDSPRAEFTAAEVHEAVPEMSRDYLGVTLRGLRDAGIVERIGVGRGARWRRIGEPCR
jgi:Fic family protein